MSTPPASHCGWSSKVCRRCPARPCWRSAATRRNTDGVRRRLMWEPGGHADMYGAIVTEPVARGSDCGVLFLHNEGFRRCAGMASSASARSSSRPACSRRLRAPSPYGSTHRRGSWWRTHHTMPVVRGVAFENVPSFVYRRGIKVDLPGIGQTACDIAFGGAYYAFCEAATSASPAAVAARSPDRGRQAREGGRAVQTRIDDPLMPDLGFLYGVILTGPPVAQGHHSRHVCIFAEGEVDRSPTGTGVSARAALLHDAGDCPTKRPSSLRASWGPISP